jgi:hypothetical protein
MTNTEASIRMAEIAKVNLWSGDDLYIKFSIPNNSKKWNPRENIEQAMEVLDTFSFYEITKQSSLSCSWYVCEVNGFQGTGGNVCEAIFQAVKAYLEGEG